MSSTTDPQNAALVVEARFPAGAVRLGAPCPVAVTLRNDGAIPVAINRRLTVGYDDSLSREIFVQVTDPLTGAPVPYDPVDYDRDFPAASDYGPLAPAARLTAEFDMFQWYPLTNPGTYRVVVVYQGVEPLAHAPAGTWSGSLKSAEYTLQVE